MNKEYIKHISLTNEIETIENNFMQIIDKLIEIKDKLHGSNQLKVENKIDLSPVRSNEVIGLLERTEMVTKRTYVILEKLTEIVEAI